MKRTAIKSVRRWGIPGLTLILAALAIVFARTTVLAHPLSQGAMKLVLFRDHIELEARVPFEEVVVASAVSKGAAPLTLSDGLKAHGEYLIAHIQLLADGQPLAGSLLSFDGGAERKEGAAKASDWVTFRLRYELGSQKTPAQFKLSQNILSEIEYAPGNRWEATYIVSVVREHGNGEQGLLLTATQPLIFPNASNGAGEARPASSWSTFKSFCWHGITHILTGYDHLLFIATLVLAAGCFWDLFKVVAAFTLAHGLTLTLSVLDIVRLPERIVEPMIAASIVYVAIENIFFPKRTRNWTRLGAAFFFGLFHGLGFAGGLLEAMQGMPGATIAIALIAFSIGVELGHQAVVVPLYTTISLLRTRQPDETARARFSDRIRLYASAAISIAGLFYFVAALGWRA
jgi:hydrogenase/urease accessory protein HupE